MCVSVSVQEADECKRMQGADKDNKRWETRKKGSGKAAGA